MQLVEQSTLLLIFNMRQLTAIYSYTFNFRRANICLRVSSLTYCFIIFYLYVYIALLVFHANQMRISLCAFSSILAL